MEAVRQTLIVSSTNQLMPTHPDLTELLLASTDEHLETS